MIRTQWFNFRDDPPEYGGEYEMYCAAPAKNPLPEFRAAGLYDIATGARVHVRFAMLQIPIAALTPAQFGVPRIDCYHSAGELWWRGIHAE